MKIYVYLHLIVLFSFSLYAQETARFVYPFVKPLPVPENYHPKVYLDYDIVDSLDYVSVFLINNSEEAITITVHGSELDFGIGMEFLNKDQKWVDRDTLYPDGQYEYRCIVGVYDVKIPPHMFVSKKMNKQYGSYHTLARYKFYTDGQLIYSEPFEVRTDSLYIHKSFHQYLEDLDLKIYSRDTGKKEKEEWAVTKVKLYRHMYKLEEADRACKKMLTQFPESSQLSYLQAHLYLSVVGKNREQYSETFQRAVCYASLELFKSIKSKGENSITGLETWIEELEVPFTSEMKKAFLKEFECEESEESLLCYIGYPVDDFITIKY